MSKSKYERGMEVRRKVLGDAHVDRSWNKATDFDHDFQELITETAWGSVWSRPGLDLNIRHMVTISIPFTERVIGTTTAILGDMVTSPASVDIPAGVPKMPE